jgi:hypothetical protein
MTQEITRNKSTTYLLPLLFSDMDMEFSYLIVNTYIKFTPPIEEVERPIGVLFEDENSDAFNEFLMGLESHELFVRAIIKDNTLLYIFRFPSEFCMDYDLFKESKYSQMSYEAKKKILKYSSEVYKYPPLVEDITGVLWKHKARRAKMERELGIIIPDDIELASKIIYENETFTF